MSKLTPSRITQQDASRIMFAHAKAVEADRRSREYVGNNSKVATRKADLQAAEAAFEALIQQMVEDENA
jgi:hypothetical protein